jgi:hypothetical protein
MIVSNGRRALDIPLEIETGSAWDVRSRDMPR